MSKKDDKTEAGETTKLPYPKAIVFIIGNELCERFNYFGFRAILALYLKRIIGFTEDEATVIFHVWIVLMYFLAVGGAIISDNWLGRYRTIWYLSSLYCFGEIVVTLGSVPPLHLPRTVFVLSGLALVACGSGGIKPSIAPFGGDQFKLPEQNDQLNIFFSWFYFSANVGSLASMLLTPIFRADVHCFGDLHCYPLAFGVPAVLMFIAIVLFILGRPWYRIAPQKSNMLVQMVMAIFHAIANKRRSTEKREHWLDYADDKYDKQVITDIKAVLNLLVLYIPLPVYWALYDQQGSRWIFQASRMDGDIGSWDIKPEQMGVFNPALVLILIPICNYAIFPLVSLIGIRRPLQKICTGGVLVGCSFIISGFLEFQLEKTYPILPKEKNAQLRIFNGEACNYDITTNIEGQEKFILKSLDVYTYRDINVPNGKFDLIYTISSADVACPVFTPTQISIPEKTAHSIFLNSKNAAQPIIDFEDNVDKPRSGLPQGRVLANIKDSSKVHWKDTDHGISNYDAGAHEHKLQGFTKGKHEIFVDDKKVLEIGLRLGGCYTIIVNEKPDGTYEAQTHFVTEPNSLHMLWQLPQISVITLGEIFYSITALQFNYSQAPLTMKSVVTAFWLLTYAGGNIIVALISGIHLMKQSYEFLLFSVLVFISMAVFALFSYAYKIHDPNAPV